MENVDDDFGELYADVGIQATSAINTAPKSPQLYINSSNQQKINNVDRQYTSDDSPEEQQYLSNNDAKLGEDDRRRENSSGTGNVENAAVGDGIESESEEDEDEDDFVLVVNDDDFAAKTGGAEGKRGGEEAVEIEHGGAEANLPRNGVNHSASGNNCGGEVIGNAIKFNGGNSQYKYVRRNGVVSMGNQRMGISRRVDKDDTGCVQPRRSSSGSFEPTYAGSAVLGFGDQGNGFWLPRYRTIVDVDIDNFEQKPWTRTGADTTDYFNFGFDEDSWRNYCQSLDQLRQQTLIQMRNYGCGNSRSNLVGGGASKLLEPKEVSEWESGLDTRQFNRQIGQAIHVEDSNIERQPSMDIKPPRNFDSDVVIEITLQEQEEPSDSLKEPDDKQQRQSLSPEIPKSEEPDDDLKDKLEISEEGCEEGRVVRDSQISGDLKSYELRKLSAEDSIHSPVTSSDIRSHESASVSSSMHENSSIQMEGPNSESEAQSSGKMDIFSGGNQRAPKILKDDASSDRDSTDANPCVAGIDLLSDEHIESTTTSSYSRSERLNNVDHCDLRKSRSFQSSSPDSVMDRSQVARDTYLFSRVSKRDDVDRKGSRHTHSQRLRNPIEEGRKLSQRNFLRHSETSNHRNNCDHHNDLPKHMRVDGYSSLNHRDEDWRHSSDFTDEDWPSHQENYSRSSDDRDYVENQFHAEFRKDSYPQKHWDLLEDASLNAQRGCDEDRIYSERTQRMRDDMGHRDRLLEERGFVFRKEKSPFHNQPHSILKYHSSTDMDWHSQYREIDDDHLNKRSKHDTPVDYRFSDYPMIDRYAHSPLHGRHRDYWDSELEHQGRLRHCRRYFGTYFREDEFFDHPSSDLHYPQFIREDNEYQNRQMFPSIRDYQDEQSLYAERRHNFTLSRNDPDVHLLCPRYERNSRYASAKKSSRDFGQHYDNRDAIDREDTGIYCHQDDYFENRRHVFQSGSMDLQDDVILQSNSNNAVCDEMLDSVKGIPRNKWRGAKHGCVSGKMRMHAHDMEDRYGVICAGGKFSARTSKALLTAKDERTGLCRNPVKLHNVRETESSGNVSKTGSAPKNDARLNADWRFQKHLKKQQEVAAPCPETAVNIAQKVEASQSVSSSHWNDSDLEEGQIPTEEPSTKIVKASKFVPGGLAKKDNVKGRLRCGQESVNQNDSRVYDESRILASMAKMEKRRERFKGPILEKKDSDSDPKPQVVEIVETPKSTGQRPSRKRQWGGS